jgi:hypothetical protein
VQVAKSCNDTVSNTVISFRDSEWLVKARGNQSSVRIELIGPSGLRVARLWKSAGARSIGVAP